MCPNQGTLSLSQLQGTHFTACHSYRALLIAYRSLSQPVTAYHSLSQPVIAYHTMSQPVSAYHRYRALFYDNSKFHVSKQR